LDKELLELLAKMAPNIDQMSEYINKSIVTAFDIIDQPCGQYLISKNMYNALLTTAGITEQELKTYLISQFKQQSAILKSPSLGYIITNPLYNLLLLYMLVFLANDKIDDAHVVARLYGCLTLSYLKKKYFRSCNPDIMRYTLNNLHGLSVAGKSGFSGLVIKMADETLDRYKDVLVNEINPYYYYRFLIDIRNKLNQAVKTIASKYYKNVSSISKSSYIDEAEAIMQNLNEVIASPQVIDYLSHITTLPTLEIEDILLKLESNTDTYELLENIIIQILTDYDGSIDRIRDIGTETILNKINNKDKYISITDEILHSISIDNITQNHRNVILMLCILLILWRR